MNNDTPGLIAKLPRTEKSGWPWDSETNKTIYTSEIPWPKISIITPSYGQAEFIEETIRSVILQNYPNIEYIVIDGGSQDGTLDILRKYTDFINYWVSEKDEGQSHAIIKGFSAASGSIYNWINSDDILHDKGLYQIAKAFLENPEVDFVHGRNGIINIGSTLIDYMPHPKDNLQLRYLYEMPYGQQACFFSASLYKEVGGINKELRFSMDYELYVKMHLLNAKSVQIDQLIGSVRIHPKTKTYNLEEIMYKENGNVFLGLLKSLNRNNEVKLFLNMGFRSYNLYTVKRNVSNQMAKTLILLFLKKNIWYYYNKRKYEIACKMAFNIIKLDKKNLFNQNYLKIIKDATIRILQPGRPG